MKRSSKRATEHHPAQHEPVGSRKRLQALSFGTFIQPRSRPGHEAAGADPAKERWTLPRGLRPSTEASGPHPRSVPPPALGRLSHEATGLPDDGGRGPPHRTPRSPARAAPPDRREEGGVAREGPGRALRSGAHARLPEARRETRPAARRPPVHAGRCSRGPKAGAASAAACRALPVALRRPRVLRPERREQMWPRRAGPSGRPKKNAFRPNSDAQTEPNLSGWALQPRPGTPT